MASHKIDIRHVGDHRRQWRDCRYVYPVIARRSKGLSIGVNVNPDKRCNFACAYCQVDRHIRRPPHEVDIPTLRRELLLAVAAAMDGSLWAEPKFASVPPPLRRINDIAFSGDGEPTCLANFDEAVAAAADVRRAAGCEDAKIVVITNATQLSQPQFQRALPILDANNGEIWAKLDAGTDDYFQTVNRPHPRVALDEVVKDIADIAHGRAVVIQSLFLKLSGHGPTDAEIAAYGRRLKDILAAGGTIKLVQAHTIARPPMMPTASALSDAELDAIAQRIRADLLPAAVPVEVYYGAAVPPQKR